MNCKLSANKLIKCEDCGAEISKSAKTCPKCGRQNDWIDPRFRKIEAYIRTSDRNIEYEIDNEKMSLSALTTNIRQKIGIFAVFLSMVMFLLSFFFPGLTSIGLFFLILGGTLTLYGLSAFNRKELVIDLGDLQFDTPKYDKKFWADVIAIVTAPDTESPSLVSNDEEAAIVIESPHSKDELPIEKSAMTESIPAVLSDEKAITGSNISYHSSNNSPVEESSDLTSKSIAEDKDEGVLQYWFSSPKQTIITIVGFASIVWLGIQLLNDDKSKLLSCTEQMMKATAGGVSPHDYANYLDLHALIDGSENVEIIKIDQHSVGGSIINAYQIRVDGQKTEFLSTDC